MSARKRFAECKCEPRLTCAFCLRNRKPWHWTPGR